MIYWTFTPRWVVGFGQVRIAAWGKHPSCSFFLQSLLSFGHSVTRQAVELWVLKPLEKICSDFKKINKHIFFSPLHSSQTRFSTFKVCLCMQAIYNPGTCEFFFLQNGNFFMVRVISGADSMVFSAGWPQPLAAQCSNSYQGLAHYLIRWSGYGSLSSSVPTMKVSGKLWCSLNNLPTTKGGRYNHLSDEFFPLLLRCSTHLTWSF